MKKILIAGAFGFVGTNLSNAFRTVLNSHLIAIDVNEPEKHSFDDYFSWNELDKIDWSSIDTVIHLAGKAHDTQNTIEEKAYFDINVGLTQKIFEYFLQSNASKFIFFSSVKAVADNVNGEYLKEDAVSKPKTAYGKSKMEAENYIFSQTLPEDKKIYILRPSMIHGPGNKGNLNLLYQLVKKGIPWPLGSFENKRSFTSIDNLTFVIQEIIEKEISPGIYQIADDEPLSTNRLIQLISESKNRKVRIWNINKKLILNIAKLGDVLHLPLNSERLKKLTESYLVSNKKLITALGIKKMPVNAADGMRKTMSSFK